MKKIFLTAFSIAAIAISGSTTVFAQVDKGTKMVGGATMYPSKDIVDNAVNSKDHTAPIAAVKAAGLVETLKGNGPFTVFAPTNRAFDKLPAGTVDNLPKAENKKMLTKILTYHVVAGKMDSRSIAAAIKKGKGKAEFSTVEGGKLWAWMQGDKLMLQDEKGEKYCYHCRCVSEKRSDRHRVDAKINA